MNFFPWSLGQLIPVYLISTIDPVGPVTWYVSLNKDLAINPQGDATASGSNFWAAVLKV